MNKASKFNDINMHFYCYIFSGNLNNVKCENNNLKYRKLPHIMWSKNRGFKNDSHGKTTILAFTNAMSVRKKNELKIDYFLMQIIKYAVN